VALHDRFCADVYDRRHDPLHGFHRRIAPDVRRCVQGRRSPSQPARHEHYENPTPFHPRTIHYVSETRQAEVWFVQTCKQEERAADFNIRIKICVVIDSVQKGSAMKAVHAAVLG
jgi:hypothetical protein